MAESSGRNHCPPLADGKARPCGRQSEDLPATGCSVLRVKEAGTRQEDRFLAGLASVMRPRAAFFVLVLLMRRDVSKCARFPPEVFPKGNASTARVETVAQAQNGVMMHEIATVRLCSVCVVHDLTLAGTPFAG